MILRSLGSRKSKYSRLHASEDAVKLRKICSRRKITRYLKEILPYSNRSSGHKPFGSIRIDEV